MTKGKKHKTAPQGQGQSSEEQVKSSMKAAQEQAEAMADKLEEEPEKNTGAEEKTQEAPNDYLEDLQRLKAEFANYRKRVEREKTEFVKYANSTLMAELTEVLDAFERGMHEEHSKDVPEGYRKGIEAVFRKFKELLEKNGLEKVATVGETFNPEVHEAVMQEPSTEYAPGVVSGEIRPGYKLNDRLLRAPLVKVATAPAEKSKEQ